MKNLIEKYRTENTKPISKSLFKTYSVLLSQSYLEISYVIIKQRERMEMHIAKVRIVIYTDKHGLQSEDNVSSSDVEPTC